MDAQKMNLLVEAFLFFLPAGIANMAPIFATRIPLLKQWSTPIDFGRQYRARRILGDNKTWRGLLFGTLVGGLSCIFIQSVIASSQLGLWNLFLTGCLLGAGALLGDAFESFIKRQRGIDPGKSWFPFDQTDYIIGGLLLAYPVTRVSIAIIVVVLLLYFGLHLLVSYIGYLLRFKQSPI